MMNKNVKLAIWSALVTLVLIALPSIIHYAPQLVGKSFTDQQDFNYTMEQVYEELSVSVLNPIDVKEAEKELAVSKDEIDEYRQRYGTLSEQLESIQQQYTDQIKEAKSDNNETLLLALVKERNMKLDDIQQNFSNDSHVEDKIRTEKAKELASWVQETENSYQQNIPIAYDLVNTETGKRFTKGDIEVTSLFHQEFSETTGYFKADSAVYDNYTDYSMDGSSFSGEEQGSISNPPQYFEGTIIIPSDAAVMGSLAEGNDNFIRGKYMIYALWHSRQS